MMFKKSWLMKECECLTICKMVFFRWEKIMEQEIVKLICEFIRKMKEEKQIINTVIRDC